MTVDQEDAGSIPAPRAIFEYLVTYGRVITKDGKVIPLEDFYKPAPAPTSEPAEQ